MRAGSRPDLRDYVSREGLAQLTAAAAAEHTGAMIALLPSEADAARLALDDGEPAGELHCTLWFLGEAAPWTENQRSELIAAVRARAATLGGPVRAHLFGVNHWNPHGDDPAWVWAVGDDMDSDEPGLLGARWVAQDALEGTDARPETPRQHSPWVAHVTATYTADTWPLTPMIERLGPVVFDRVRIAFGGDHTDVPLTGSVTAAAGPLRRQPTDLETRARVDFADINDAWHQAVDDTLTAWADIQQAQREQITAAVQAAAEADDLDQLDTLTVDTGPAAELLYARMRAYAERAGRAQQAEAEAQGVTVPEWSLDDEAVTAAAFRDRIRQVARTTARLLGAGLVTSGVRAAMRLFGSGSPAQVAGQVDDHLAGLSDASVREAIGGAMSAAQNEGRMAVLSVAPPGTYVSSEALDASSCQPCRQVDGTRYGSLAEARAAYPTGGYTGCLGGARCRGFVVAVWNEDEDDEQAAAGTIMALAAATIPPTDHEQGGTVYRTVQDHPDCGADTPWAVTDDEGELQGCYATQAEADAACAGMADDSDSNDDPAGMPDEGGMDYAGDTAPWEGPLAVEGIVTGDGREFAPGALTWADLPIPLRWNKEDSHGGEPRTIAVNVGRIDEVWRDGERIMGRGVLDLSDEDGRRVHAKIEGKFLRGVSIDADSIADADTEFVWPDDVNAGTGDDEGEPDMFEMLFAQPEKVIFHGGRIRAATLVDIPAFAEAYIALLDEAGAVVAGGQPVTEQELQALVVQELGAVAVHETATSDGSWDGPANEKRLSGPLTVEQARAAYAWYDGSAEADGELPKSACKFLHHEINADGTVGAANLTACSATIAALHGARGGTSIPAADRRGVYDHVAAHLRDAGREPEPFRALHAVTAGAEVWRPPAEWFTDPKLSLPTPITVTDDGRIYGHAAQWGSCHIGQDDVCVQPPHEDAHPYYRTGEVVCADGSRVAVGQITVGTGHAPLHMGAVPAAEHYDNTGAAVADVAVGNDANGIWVAGCVRPGADPLKVYELQAAGQVSGDWRRIGGQLRLVGLLAVNVPGFPVPKMRARVASGEPQALLAAGRPTVAWGRSQTEMEREAVRIVMRMLSRRVHPGGR